MWLFATCHWSQSGLSLNEKSEQYFISKGYFIIIIVILMKVHGLNRIDSQCFLFKAAYPFI